VRTGGEFVQPRRAKTIQRSEGSPRRSWLVAGETHVMRGDAVRWRGLGALWREVCGMMVTARLRVRAQRGEPSHLARVR
jgi:hypothetical protein